MALDIMACYVTPPPPRDPVLPGLMPGTVGSIVSPGGAGKSMLALLLAHMVGGGVDLLNLGPHSTGLAAYLSAEDGADALHERLHAIGSRLSPEQREACAAGMLIEDLTPHAPDLLDSRWLESVEAIAVDARLLFIDTLRSFHTGDENDGNKMAALIGSLRSMAARTRCAIVFLHHSSKALAVAGQGDMQQASRGSSVLTDNIRWQGYLAGMTRDEACGLSLNGAEPIGADDRGFFVRFGISKQNYGAPFNERWFRRGQGGVLESVELAQLAAGPRAARRRDGV